MVDTHTSNGADYQHTMTLIATQPDKLGGALGALPARDHAARAVRGDGASAAGRCARTSTRVKEIPDDGIEDFLETPRFSTGYAALHHTIGFMPETHMLKPFARPLRACARWSRPRSTSRWRTAQQIQAAARRDAARRIARGARGRCSGRLDESQPVDVPLQGLRGAVRAEPARQLPAPALRPRARRSRRTSPSSIASRPTIDGDSAPRGLPDPAGLARGGRAAALERRRAAPRSSRRRRSQVEAYRVRLVPDARGAVRGAASARRARARRRALRRTTSRAGDWLVPARPGPRAATWSRRSSRSRTTASSAGASSTACSHRKERFSDYVFEDVAEQLLEEEPGLRERFEAWKRENPSAALQPAARARLHLRRLPALPRAGVSCACRSSACSMPGPRTRSGGTTDAT